MGDIARAQASGRGVAFCRARQGEARRGEGDEVADVDGVDNPTPAAATTAATAAAAATVIAAWVLPAEASQQITKGCENMQKRQ